jgi:hypothetical protein
MEPFFQISATGFVGYCDGLVARKNIRYNEYFDFEAFLISMVGTASHIKTLSAQLFTGNPIKMRDFAGDGEKTDYDPTIPTCTFFRAGTTPGQIKTLRSRNVGDVVNKIVIHQFVEGDGDEKAAVVFGPDFPTVQERAFLRLDAETTIPLKRTWMAWLWESVLQPEELFSFGDEELRCAYLVSWPSDEELETIILAAVRDNTLK